MSFSTLKCLYPLSLFGLLLVFSCTDSTDDATGTTTGDDSQIMATSALKHWEIEALSDSLKLSGSNSLVVFEEASMAGVYWELGVGDSLVRSSLSDELFYLHEGEATILTDGDEEIGASGHVFFGKAGTETLFTAVTSPLQLLIVRMQASDPQNPIRLALSQAQIESPRNGEENVWNPFISFANVILGLYMLPQIQNGDRRLVHTWQELNIVTAGTSRFITDEGAIQVSRGSIFFVDEGNGHYFTDLGADIDILILWEQP